MNISHAEIYTLRFYLPFAYLLLTICTLDNYIHILLMENLLHRYDLLEKQYLSMNGANMYVDFNIIRYPWMKNRDVENNIFMCGIITKIYLLHFNTIIILEKST